MLKRLQPWLLLALFVSLPPTLVAKTYIDRTAGIKFTVPFTNARIARHPELPAQQPSAAAAPVGHVVVSTAIYSPQMVPALMITVHGAKGKVTKQLADSLSPQANDHGRGAAIAWLGPEAHGLSNFAFDPHTLRGIGDLPPEQGVRSKILLQLVHNRVTALRYNYRTAKDLEGWQIILDSLKVGRLSKLSYATLPDAGPNRILAWVAGILGAIALVVVITSLTWFAYKKMARGPEFLQTAGFPAVGPEAAPGAADEPYFPMIASARSSLPKGADS